MWFNFNRWLLRSYFFRDVAICANVGLHQNLKWLVESSKYFLIVVLVTAIDGSPKPEICFMSERLKRTLLSKERYGDSLCGHESHTQPSN